MPAVNLGFMRTWVDEVALGVERVTESKAALRGLVRDSAAADDITHALASGSTWDDPFDAALEMAEAGNRGLYDGWTKAEAAQSILSRAVSKHPGGAGQLELMRAQSIAEQASGDLGNWISTGGSSSSLKVLEASVRAQLDEVRSLGLQVIRNA
jgi:hypothetical protein